MNYLARKITRSKWEKAGIGMQPEDIRADAITACLRTHGDTLSTWECEDHEADITEAILALAAAGDQIDKMDVVLLDKDELLAADVVIKPTPENARTPVADLAHRHVDIVDVHMQRLCAISLQVARLVRSDSHCYQFSRKRVAALIFDALLKDRIDADSLNPKLAAELERILKAVIPRR